MSALLGGLGEKLADKWVSALAVRGLLLRAASAAAAVLGQADALDLAALRDRAGQEAARAGGWSTVAQLAALGAVVLGSVAVGALRRPNGLDRCLVGTRRPGGCPADRPAGDAVASAPGRDHHLYEEMPIPAPGHPEYEANRAEIHRLTASTLTRFIAVPG